MQNRMLKINAFVLHVVLFERDILSVDNPFHVDVCVMGLCKTLRKFIKLSQSL